MLLDLLSLETPPSIFSYAPTGAGLTFGATAGVAKIKAVSASGGIAFGGAADHSLTKVIALTGGITFGGAADHSLTKVVAPAGGIAFGGAAGVVKIKAIGSTGGISFAGAASVAKVSAATGSGGLALGGGAAVLKIKAVAPNGGGIAFAGSASASFIAAGDGAPQTFVYVVSGTLQFGGEAGCVFAVATAPPPPFAGFGGGGYVGRGATPRRTDETAPRGRRVRTYHPSGGMAFGGTAACAFVRAAATPVAREAKVFSYTSRGVTRRRRGSAQVAYRPDPRLSRTWKLEARRHMHRPRGAAVIEWVDRTDERRRDEEETLILLGVL
jgi:hypothetical protein